MMKRLYVSCKQGDDTWSGTLAAPNAERTDGPLRTLAAAQHAVRKIRRAKAEPEAVEVVLGGGCYPLERTWKFGAADSGFGVRGHFDGRTIPVIWRGAEGETVTISGGRRIARWQPATLNGRAVWCAETPWMDCDERFFRQLWVNGERRPRARLPKQGTYRVADDPGATLHSGNHAQGAERFGFRPGDLSAGWTNIEAVEVQFRALWISSRARIQRVDEAAAIARLDRNTQLRLANEPGDGVDYIVENVLEALTEPGEWCLDPVARCVWYLPRPGERPDALDGVAGGIERLIELRDARFLRFENLVFAHAEWRPAADDPVTTQSSATVSGAVVAGSGCEGIVFEGCRIEHVGGYGLECADGAKEIVFRSGAIHDIGAGAAKIWHGCRRCTIEDSELHDGGHLWMSGAGVLIGKATGNTVQRCHIHDFNYTGVSVGWTWGYAESDAYGNAIEWNHIHDIGKGLLSDMGGVYLLGNAAGTRVRHNRIHDIRSLRYGGWGIYPDEGSSDLLIENNLCYSTTCDPFFQHYGRNNTVRNNVFMHGGEGILGYGWINTAAPAATFERNILVARGTPIVRRVDPERWRAGQFRFEGNLYWCEDGDVRFEGGWRNLATQPFKGGMAAEAPRFRPLPADGAVIRALYVQGKGDEAVEDAGEFRFGRGDQVLTVTGRFAGSPGKGIPGQPPWGDWRTHIELFLKPFASHPAMVRFCVTADGGDSVTWFGCDWPKAFDWSRVAAAVKDGWSATLTVSLDALAAWFRRAGGISDATPAEWLGLCSVALPLASLDFAAWQRHSGDAAGIVADPMFVAPQHGDFRLRPDSPALALGFVPFECGCGGAEGKRGVD